MYREYRLWGFNVLFLFVLYSHGGLSFLDEYEREWGGRKNGVCIMLFDFLLLRFCAKETTTIILHILLNSPRYHPIHLSKISSETSDKIGIGTILRRLA